MFDPEKAIEDWRRQMLATGIKTPVPLEELETHLREEIARQIDHGLTKPEAFTAAVSAIGQPGAVQIEFTKLEMEKGGWLAKSLRTCVIILSWSAVLVSLWSAVAKAWPIIGIGGISYAVIQGHRLNPVRFIVFPWLVLILLPLVPWWRSTVLVRWIAWPLFFIASCLLILSPIGIIHNQTWNFLPVLQILTFLTYLFQTAWFFLQIRGRWKNHIPIRGAA